MISEKAKNKKQNNITLQDSVKLAVNSRLNNLRIPKATESSKSNGRDRFGNYKNSSEVKPSGKANTPSMAVSEEERQKAVESLNVRQKQINLLRAELINIEKVS